MIHFYKYQATGNDFVMIDNRMGGFEKENIQVIEKICDRRFGVGADGLILIEEHPEVDFEMIYFNSDGSQSWCGNGSRAVVMFARDLGIVEEDVDFMTINGILSARNLDKIVYLRMPDVGGIEEYKDDFFIDTGVPHYVRFASNVEQIQVEKDGPEIRYNPDFKEGTNANFVELKGEDTIFVRTYERGVEAETYSCGTGVTACALACSRKGLKSPVSIQTRGGHLEVGFKKNRKGGFSEIYLSGPAAKVYEGYIPII